MGPAIRLPLPCFYFNCVLFFFLSCYYVHLPLSISVTLLAHHCDYGFHGCELCFLLLAGVRVIAGCQKPKLSSLLSGTSRLLLLQN